MVTPPDPNSLPVSTANIAWVDTDGTTHWRVYSCDGYNVVERCKDGSNDWYTGQFVEPGSAVSASVHQNGDIFYIDVFITGDDKTVQFQYDDITGWTKGDYTDPGLT